MACTGIGLTSKQGNPFWARTQDFEQHFEYSGVKIPKGYTFSSAFTPFKSEKFVMGIVWANDVRDAPVILDGINENGICGGSFYFDHFYKYSDTDSITKSGKTPIRGEELCTWILTHYSSLDEIKNNLSNDIEITNEPGPMMGMSVPQHCVFNDETGRSIVVEPSISHGFSFFENPLGVFTNAPTFDWHLSNLKTWLERISKRTYSYDVNEPINSFNLDEFTTGLVGIPADYKPESRFLRASMAKLLSIKVDDEDTLNQIFQLLTTVNTPKGLLRIHQEEEVLIPWTQYTSGYDIKNKKLYAYTYDNQNLKVLEYGDFKDWSKEIEYYTFISPRKAEPFTKISDWKTGDITL